MRLIKMLGLVGAAALVAMAFVGTGVASADSACLVDPVGGAQGECPAEKVWNGPIIGLSPEAIFDLDEKEFKCKSEFLADWIKNEGKKVGVLYLILTFTFSECTPPCSQVFAENLPWTLLVLMAPSTSGQEHAIMSEDGKGRPAFLLEDCTILGQLLNCLYEFEPTILLNYRLELNKEKLPLAGALEFNHGLFWGGDNKLCPGILSFQASYLIYEDKEKKEGGELFFTALP